MKIKTAHQGLWGDEVWVNGNRYDVGDRGVVEGLRPEDHNKLAGCPGWYTIEGAAPPKPKKAPLLATGGEPEEQEDEEDEEEAEEVGAAALPAPKVTRRKGRR